MSTSDTKNSLVHDFVDVQARIDLTPLGEILAACRISVFEHIARLESDVHAHGVLQTHRFLGWSCSSWSQLETTPW